MKLHQLLFREIAHRKFNFVMGLLCVAVAVACGVGAATLLRAFDRETDQSLAGMQAASRAAWARYNNEMRKEMLNLGFNLLILNKDYNLSSPDTEAKTLPESYAQKLAAAQMEEINHVLPFLQQNFWWPERKNWITLVGTIGEVYIKDPRTQAPMLQKVASGSAFLGYAVHQSLNLKVGDRFSLAGRQFVVEKCLPAHSAEQDTNIFIPLRDAQVLLDKKDQITGIKAINCVCEPEQLLDIQQKVSDVLPGTQVVEDQTKIIARANVLAKAARETDAALEREKVVRGDLRASRGMFSTVLIGLVVVVSAVFLGVLMWDNVRRRQMEIGILQAIGVTRRKILLLFLGKALLIGVIGATVGCAAGLAVGIVGSAGGAARAGLIDPALLGVSILAAAILSALASWIPAHMAAGIDPAVVLLKEGA